MTEAPRRFPAMRYVLPAAALGVLVLVIVLMRGAQSKASNAAAVAPAVPTAPATTAPIPAPVPPKLPEKSATAPSAARVRTEAPPADVVHQVVPEVPRKAKNSIRGKVAVSVKVSVDSSGAVQEATLDSHESSKFFANLAIRAARQWQFRPESGKDWLIHFVFTKTESRVRVERLGG